MSATIHDVASKAGVSIATVSRVLNRSSPVSSNKRALVLEAADALGYSPNPAALSLLSKRTGGIGVLLPFLSGEFFSELLRGLDDAAHEHGLVLIVSSSHRSPSDFQRSMRMVDKRVDGLVVMAPEIDPASAASILERDTPVVFINTYADGVPADVINFDNHAGGLAVTQHLLDLGHRRIAMVRGPDDARDAHERARGYRDAMRRAGVTDTAALEIPGGYARESGFEAAQEILRWAERPTAVVAANDYCAKGVMSALSKEGVQVPEEVSVTGFDGLPSGEYSVPPLTTVRVPIREIGYRAIRQLAMRLGGELADGGHLRRVEPVELVARGSTAPEGGAA